MTNPVRRSSARLGWRPPLDDACLVAADRVFVKHGYLPTAELVDHLRALRAERVLVCGIQADTCVLAAGFALFDAGLQPTLIGDLVLGSSLDRSGAGCAPVEASFRPGRQPGRGAGGLRLSGAG